MTHLCTEDLVAKLPSLLFWWLEKLTVLFLLLLLSSSCSDKFTNPIIEEEVINDDDQVTIRANLFDSSRPNQSIFVYYSEGMLDSTITPITDAVVDLYEEKNWITNFSFVLEENGEVCERYVAESIIFKPGKNYTLKVENLNERLESTQTFPTKVTINSATYEKEGTIDRYGNLTDAISIEFDDPEGEKNYYVVSTRATYLFEGKDTIFISDWWIDSTPVDPIIEKIRGGFFFTDASIDGKNYTLKFATIIKEQQTSFPLANGETIEGQLLGLKAKLTSVSQDYYEYWKSLETFENDKDDFVKIHENVEGGYGIFTLNSVDEYVIDL